MMRQMSVSEVEVSGKADISEIEVSGEVGVSKVVIINGEAYVIK